MGHNIMTDIRTIRKLAKEKGYALVKIEKPVDGGFDKVEEVSLRELERLCTSPPETFSSVGRYDLNVAFNWRTTPQGADHWDDIFLGRIPLTAADIKWLKGLYQHWKKK